MKKQNSILVSTEAVNEFTEFIKQQLETLRESTVELHRIDSLNILADDIISDIEGPIYEMAYDLLKQLYIVSGDNEQTIYDNFIDYLMGRKYENLDEFIKWLEEV